MVRLRAAYCDDIIERRSSTKGGWKEEQNERRKEETERGAEKGGTERETEREKKGRKEERKEGDRERRANAQRPGTESFKALRWKSSKVATERVGKTSEIPQVRTYFRLKAFSFIVSGNLVFSSVYPLRSFSPFVLSDSPFIFFVSSRFPSSQPFQFLSASSPAFLSLFLSFLSSFFFRRNSCVKTPFAFVSLSFFEAIFQAFERDFQVRLPSATFRARLFERGLRVRFFKCDFSSGVGVWMSPFRASLVVFVGYFEETGK